MREFFKTKRFKIVIGILVALLVLMIVSASVGNKSGSFLSVIVSPAQKLSTWISNGATGFFSNIANSGKNAKENDELKKQVTSLREQLVDFYEIKDENQQLKEMMGLKETHKDFEYEAAMVIGRDANDRYGSFQIDKGSLSGVALYDPVITRDGLVGYISKVNPTSARVATILSSDINVGASGLYSGETGVVTGEPSFAEKGQCKLKYLLRDSAIAKSELVVTTGLSGIFPKGLIIGTVEKVKPEAGGTSVYAVIEPSVQISEVKNVFVIKSFTGQGGDDNDANTTDKNSSKEDSSK